MYKDKKMSGFYMKVTEKEVTGTKGPKGESGPNTDIEIPRTAIAGYTFNENVSCKNCKYFKVNYDDWGDGETCTHKENNHYTYDHRGRHSNIIWRPADKNKKLDCELWEEKKSILQKIKINFGFKE